MILCAERFGFLIFELAETQTSSSFGSSSRLWYLRSRTGLRTGETLFRVLSDNIHTGTGTWLSISCSRKIATSLLSRLRCHKPKNQRRRYLGNNLRWRNVRSKFGIFERRVGGTIICSMSLVFRSLQGWFRRFSIHSGNVAGRVAFVDRVVASCVEGLKRNVVTSRKYFRRRGYCQIHWLNAEDQKSGLCVDCQISESMSFERASKMKTSNEFHRS